MNRRSFVAGAALVSIPGPAICIIPGKHPDAELMAAADRFVHLEHLFTVRNGEADRHPFRDLTEKRRLEAIADATSTEQHDVGDDMARFRAQTLEGITAKARAVLVYLGSEEQHDMISRLMLSIAEDVAAFGSSGA